MLILPSVLACGGTAEPPTSSAPADTSDTSDTSEAGTGVCGEVEFDATSPDAWRCEAWAGIPGGPIVEYEGTPCDPAGSSWPYCQVDQSLDQKCVELYGGACPSFLELLESSGWLAGEPQLTSMNVVRLTMPVGPDYDYVKYYLDDPPPSLDVAHVLLHYFDVDSGELLAIQLEDWGYEGVETWCCDGHPMYRVTWGAWSHQEAEEGRTYHPEDFE